ncbi:hypothetical protein COMNV_00893 [Commensalibacter sp. Nvir]|uniref:hypothetical protein n=1 Tax=Commensalibacter sp. Nvir TaxID=3069817 RepID=UPI002D2BC567|nr:hypothetical protein COMNV_00893 [Commensalibacter sp. Nvir]
MLILLGITKDLVLLVLYAGLGALGFRWAGGLLSRWLERDLGDQLPRLLWGWIACLPLIVVFARDVHSIMIIALIACLTGLMRGVGWGNSLSLGFVSVGNPGPATKRKLWVMASRLALMQALPFITAGYFLSAHALLLVIPILGCFFLASCGLSIMGYYEAWLYKGLYIPSLGCDPMDPPPTGELIAGASTGLFLGLAVMMIGI